MSNIQFCTFYQAIINADYNNQIMSLGGSLCFIMIVGYIYPDNNAIVTYGWLHT